MTHVVRAWRASRTIRLFVLIALFGTATKLVLSQESRVVQNATRQTKMIGADRLVSVEPLPEMDGEICLPPSNANVELMASLQPQNVAPAYLAARPPQQSRGAGTLSSNPPRPSDAVRGDVAKRQPLSVVKDPRNTFAGLVVDPIRNEVVFAEENNFSILVYDRTTNTPAQAALSEPKRMIQGQNTYLEYSCGVYVDPATGDIYGINNDTLNWMTVFDRNAKGNATPNRKLATPHSTFAIVADEENQELLMTIQDPHAIVTFKKSAKNQDAPVRLIQGPKTRLADPHGLALDPKTGLIYVTNWGTHNLRRIPDGTSGAGRGRGNAKPNWPAGGGDNSINGSGRWELPSITVYRKDAQGDVAPIREIQGPKTLMNWPTSIAVHPDRGELFVANDTGDTITVYRTDANGDAAPIRVIKGPRSMIKNPTGIALDLTNNELWVANFGNHSATVYPVDASGDPAPKRIIRSGRPNDGAAMLSNPHTIAYDTKREQLLVSN